MATCEPAGPSALGWLASRRRGLAAAVAVVILTALLGLSLLADDWMGRIAWFVGGIAALWLVAQLDQWSYHRFLVRSDRAWIAGLGVADADRHGQYHEMVERLRARWDGGRGRALPDAVAACLGWIETQRELSVGQRRKLVVRLCATVQKSSRASAPSAVILDRLRRQLIDIDRGRVDVTVAQSED